MIGWLSHATWVLCDIHHLRTVECCVHLKRSTIFKLVMCVDRTKSGDAPGPIILGAADLGDEQVKAELLKVRAAHEAVVLTNATEADSERLRLLLGHPNAAHGLRGSKTGLAAGGTAPLIYFRTAPRPGTKAFDYSTGFFINLPTPLSDRTIQWLTQIFSATAVVPTAPAGSPANDLQVIADSNTTRVSNENPEKTQVQIVNSVWDVRSFPNSNNPNQPATDYYYVLQEWTTRQPGARRALFGLTRWIAKSTRCNPVFFSRVLRVRSARHRPRAD